MLEALPGRLAADAMGTSNAIQLYSTVSSNASIKMYHRGPITCKIDFVLPRGIQDSGAERCPQTRGRRAVGGRAGVWKDVDTVYNPPLDCSRPEMEEEQVFIFYKVGNLLITITLILLN